MTARRVVRYRVQIQNARRYLVIDVQSPNANVMEHNSMRQDCIEQCTRCHNVCMETFNYSLWLGGRYNESVHLRLLLDCAEICQTSANFMLRGSDLHRETCSTCAVVCENCAQDCERYAVPGTGQGAAMSHHSGRAEPSKEKMDEQMKHCAKVCRECTESCRQMAAMPLQG
jgi:hypothetical protein